MMSHNAKKLLKHGVLTLPLVALLVGCGGGDSKSVSSQSDPDNTIPVGEPKVRVAGGAVKGVIQQGLVTANRLVADKSGRYQTDRLAAKPVRTDDQGHYELRLKGHSKGWAVVQLTADARTRMTCDVVPRCEQAGSDPVPFGKSFTPGKDFTLRGAGDLTKGTVYLTPLSHLAVGIAERSPNGLSADALGAAYQDVERWFGLSAGSLQLTPPDLTQLDLEPGTSADAIHLAVVNAAFLALVNEPKWDSITDVIDDMMSQVTVSGQLDILGDGNNLALSDIIAASALQASVLQTTVQASVLSQKLAVVESRNVQRFRTLADVYENENGDVADSGDDQTGGDEETTGGTETPAPEVDNGNVADGGDSGTGGVEAPGDTDTGTVDSGTDAPVPGGGTIIVVDEGSQPDGSTDQTGDEPSQDGGSDVVDNDPQEPVTDGTDEDVADSGEEGSGEDTAPEDGGTEVVDVEDEAPVQDDDLLAANAARLTWQAPFTRENGVSLSMGEIAGYEVGYGLSADALSETLAIGDASVDQLMINDLEEGNWYFAIRTLDTDGNRSRWSEVVSKVIDI